MMYYYLNTVLKRRKFCTLVHIFRLELLAYNTSQIQVNPWQIKKEYLISLLKKKSKSTNWYHVETLGRESENTELERSHKIHPPKPEGQKAADHNYESE